ncbi:zonular occludens toxin domain-containing protein [Pseudomonas sp. NCCP-436]|uniref:zonular occludens toxin domain-containing protein n=1 Tax=Pseudomonas sp. NCCP-436 TaxID=2842481 RepID=UPI001C7E9075|nr:zonular occludens toxin domain-containing protein [Pseudomonas sp. NCCP-436]GIZ13888.1 membrane protein [Pseudomonas sp. NCCP-436]
MAIDAYTGLPGHGKSYGVVEHVIIPSLKQGRHVVTNIPLDVDALLVDFGGTIEQLPEDWFERADLGELAPPGSVLVLDELWRRWPNGMKANAARLEDKALLAEHRHRVDAKGRSMRVVLVTQDLAQIASWARALVETTYRMVKKSKKIYRVDIYRGAVTGPRPPRSALLRQTAGKFKPEVYRYYQSATQSQSGGVGDESVADTRGSLWRSWGLWGLVAIMVGGASFGVYGINRFFSPEPAPSQAIYVEPAPVKAKAELEPQSRTVRAASAVYNAKPDGPVMSTTWRVGGYVMSPTGSWQPTPPPEPPPTQGTYWQNTGSAQRVSKTARVVLVSNGGGTRIVPISECRFFPGQLDMYCDLDGERVTPWTGRGAVTSVIDPVPSVNPARREPDTGAGQRSATGAGASAAQPIR